MYHNQNNKVMKKSFWNQYLIYTCWSSAWGKHIRIEANITKQKDLMLATAQELLGEPVTTYELSTANDCDVSLRAIIPDGVACGNENYTYYYAFDNFEDAFSFKLTFKFDLPIISVDDNTFLVFKTREDLRSYQIQNDIAEEELV